MLLEADPAKRITIAGIFAHPWMRDAKDTVELFTNAEKNYMRGQIKDQASLNGLKDIDQLL